MTEQVAEKKGKSVAQALYAEAERVLRQKYADEFERILASLYEERGLDRRPRLSAEEREARKAEEKAAKEAAKREAAREKARAAAEALAAEYPDLVQVVG